MAIALALLSDWRVWLAGIVLGTGLWLHHDGTVKERKKWQDKIAVANATYAVNVSKLETHLQKAHSDLETQRALKVIEIKTVTKTNIEKVPEYVTVFTDAKCVIPTGLVLHHNAAAKNVPVDSPTPLALVDADSGITLSRVEATVTENYGIAHEWRTELTDCRSRYNSAYTALEDFKLKLKP